jgi:formylglycine-generating enzyme required for sulfatase activity
MPSGKHHEGGTALRWTLIAALAAVIAITAFLASILIRQPGPTTPFARLSLPAERDGRGRWQIGVGVPRDVESEAELRLVRQLAGANAWWELAKLLDRSTVSVPAGSFLMGSDGDREDERPQHRVYLDAFEIDRYEVTNAQYRRYLGASGEPAPPYWQGLEFPSGQADYPVVGVSWAEADAYCRWDGKRLPTEAEWEKACRGTAGQIYPWGDRWDPRRLNADLTVHRLNREGDELLPWEDAWTILQVATARTTAPKLLPVGSFVGGASPYGMLDASGNASEWVADWYNWAGYGALPDRNPIVSGPPWNHCVRGSAWYDPSGDKGWAQGLSRCAARNSSHETRDPRTGFRCARSNSS